MCKVYRYRVVWIFAYICALQLCEGQRQTAGVSFKQFLRTMSSVPEGRSANFRDVLVRFYSSNSTTNPSTHRLNAIEQLLEEPEFDQNKPTMIYAHGYVELVTDRSAQTVIHAYLQNGQYNVVMLDWANMAFGNYVNVALDVPAIGKETGVALLRLVKRGVPVTNLHLIGHSIGVHLMAYAARHMAVMGHKIPRLTGLDPAYPGFYPAILGQPVSKSDAMFVEIVHTDAGGYGGPNRTGHADWWPNGGARKQPDCPAFSVVLTDEDFCSHWRSWAYWAESVTGGEFLSRRCGSYDAFLRGECRDSPAVYMGLRATSNLRGNFYVRTAGTKPYALGKAGAD